MESDVLDKLYKSYYRELYLYVFSLCKNHHLTEELVSDTFYKAIMSLNGNEKHMKYWLLRVAKHLWFDYLKKKSSISIDNLELESTESGPLDNLLKTEDKRMLYKSVLSLPNKYKEVLILYYYNDYSLKEIAMILKISPGAARTLLYRARIKLKEIIHE
ncbi:sigma-70 family RNA polymerase sigma factor [Acidaminobacter sp. JC074]|uniref:RNA polymerase sigma factor n=1 Tax=Acidaminobacter sp. JC074 TaxID=2530199 RepID=UPI001F0E48CF|nr:sigma-70 family RNA polymerase sigma factor [Acidaminobacter sp. JC074]MCH4886862.1 sigma-70 family RNA polymerase sigma factor [Acidaminobacter sp. JC074]